MPKRLYITLGIMVAGIAALFFYNSLGGFEDLKVELVEKPETTIYGQEYFGMSTGKEVNALIREMHLRLEDGTLKGTLSVCYFGNPDQNIDSVRFFVGVEQSEPLPPLPEKLKSIVIRKGKAVRATINSYSVVAPNPDKVNQKLRKFAQQYGGKTGEFFMERYASEKEIYSEIYLEQ